MQPIDCRRPSRRAVVTLAASFALGLALPVEAAPSRKLFVIGRSKNKNVVHYDVKLTKSGPLNLDDPIDAYWVMRAEDGRREELTFLEVRLAYGFSIESKVSDNGFLMRLAACDRRLTVRRSGTQYQAELSIAGEQAILNKIFVQAADDDVMPRVVHIDVQGTAIASGKVLRERLRP
jgi:Domain of unknown function (DUF4833)